MSHQKRARSPPPPPPEDEAAYVNYTHYVQGYARQLQSLVSHHMLLTSKAKRSLRRLAEKEVLAGLDAQSRDVKASRIGALCCLVIAWLQERRDAAPLVAFLEYATQAASKVYDEDPPEYAFIASPYDGEFAARVTAAATHAPPRVRAAVEGCVEAYARHLRRAAYGAPEVGAVARQVDRFAGGGLLGGARPEEVDRMERARLVGPQAEAIEDEEARRTRKTLAKHEEVRKAQRKRLEKAVAAAKALAKKAPYDAFYLAVAIGLDPALAAGTLGASNPGARAADDKLSSIQRLQPEAMLDLALAIDITDNNAQNRELVAALTSEDAADRVVAPLEAVAAVAMKHGDVGMQNLVEAVAKATTIDDVKNALKALEAATADPVAPDQIRGLVRDAATAAVAAKEKALATRKAAEAAVRLLEGAPPIANASEAATKAGEAATKAGEAATKAVEAATAAVSEARTRVAENDQAAAAALEAANDHATAARAAAAAAVAASSAAAAAGEAALAEKATRSAAGAAGQAAEAAFMAAETAYIAQGIGPAREAAARCIDAALAGAFLRAIQHFEVSGMRARADWYREVLELVSRARRRVVRFDPKTFEEEIESALPGVLYELSAHLSEVLSLGVTIPAVGDSVALSGLAMFSPLRAADDYERAAVAAALLMPPGDATDMYRVIGSARKFFEANVASNADALRAMDVHLCVAPPSSVARFAVKRMLAAIEDADLRKRARTNIDALIQSFDRSMPEAVQLAQEIRADPDVRPLAVLLAQLGQSMNIKNVKECIAALEVRVSGVVFPDPRAVPKGILGDVCELFNRHAGDASNGLAVLLSKITEQADAQAARDLNAVRHYIEARAALLHAVRLDGMHAESFMPARAPRSAPSEQQALAAMAREMADTDTARELREQQRREMEARARGAGHRERFDAHVKHYAAVMAWNMRRVFNHLSTLPEEDRTEKVVEQLRMFGEVEVRGRYEGVVRIVLKLDGVPEADLRASRVAVVAALVKVWADGAGFYVDGRPETEKKAWAAKVALLVSLLDALTAAARALATAPEGADDLVTSAYDPELAKDAMLAVRRFPLFSRMKLRSAVQRALLAYAACIEAEAEREARPGTRAEKRAIADGIRRAVTFLVGRVADAVGAAVAEGASQGRAAVAREVKYGLSSLRSPDSFKTYVRDYLKKKNLQRLALLRHRDGGDPVEAYRTDKVALLQGIRKLLEETLIVRHRNKRSDETTELEHECIQLHVSRRHVFSRSAFLAAMPAVDDFTRSPDNKRPVKHAIIAKTFEMQALNDVQRRLSKISGACRTMVQLIDKYSSLPADDGEGVVATVYMLLDYIEYIVWKTWAVRPAWYIEVDKEERIEPKSMRKIAFADDSNGARRPRAVRKDVDDTFMAERGEQEALNRKDDDDEAIVKSGNATLLSTCAPRDEYRTYDRTRAKLKAEALARAAAAAAAAPTPEADAAAGAQAKVTNETAPVQRGGGGDAPEAPAETMIGAAQMQVRELQALIDKKKIVVQRVYDECVASIAVIMQGMQLVNSTLFVSGTSPVGRDDPERPVPAPRSQSVKINLTMDESVFAVPRLDFIHTQLVMRIKTSDFYMRAADMIQKEKERAERAAASQVLDEARIQRLLEGKRLSTDRPMLESIAMGMDSRECVILYVLKALRVVTLAIGLYAASQVFSERYIRDVYVLRARPPPLFGMLMFALSLDAVAQCLVTLALGGLYWSSRTSVSMRGQKDPELALKSGQAPQLKKKLQFTFDGILIETFLAEYLLSTVFIIVLCYFIARTMTRRKYFAYADEGLRVIYAYSEISTAVCAVASAIPFFRLFWSGYV
jgi:hypothetical protein